MPPFRHCGSERRYQRCGRCTVTRLGPLEEILDDLGMKINDFFVIFFCQLDAQYERGCVFNFFWTLNDILCFLNQA